MHPSGPQPTGEISVPPLPRHFERTSQSLRGALIELFSSAGVDCSVPQAVAHRLGVNKNLAWKSCKIVNGANVYQTVQHLPGAAGLTILLRAFEKIGAPPASLAAVEAAMADFDAMVEVHAGDRATLELMLDGALSGHEYSPRLEQARKLAFQGNSAVLGVRARVRAAASILAPSREDPDFLEVSVLSALVDLERLRSNVAWPLVRYHTHVEEPGKPRIEAIDPDSRAPDAPPYLHEFCSSPPELRAVPIQEGTAFELCEGRVGKTAHSTCVFGWRFPRFTHWRAQVEGERGEYFVRVDTPAEVLLYDLLVHRDLPFELPPKADFFSLILGSVASSFVAEPRYLLPHTGEVQVLGSGAHVFATPHYAEYSNVLRSVCEASGRELEDFRGYRLCVAYPPVPSLAIQHFPLPG